MTCVCDDHDKNISFTLTENGQWHLAPAYDKTFTYNFKNLFKSNRHYMTIEESDRWISRDQFLRLAVQNDIRNASEIIDTIRECASGFVSKATASGVSSDLAALIFKHIKEQVDYTG